MFKNAITLNLVWTPFLSNLDNSLMERTKARLGENNILRRVRSRTLSVKFYFLRWLWNDKGRRKHQKLLCDHKSLYAVGRGTSRQITRKINFRILSKALVKRRKVAAGQTDCWRRRSQRPLVTNDLRRDTKYVFAETCSPRDHFLVVILYFKPPLNKQLAS